MCLCVCVCVPVTPHGLGPEAIVTNHRIAAAGDAWHSTHTHTAIAPIIANTALTLATVNHPKNASDVPRIAWYAPTDIIAVSTLNNAGSLTNASRLECVSVPTVVAMARSVAGFSISDTAAASAAAAAAACCGGSGGRGASPLRMARGSWNTLSLADADMGGVTIRLFSASSALDRRRNRLGVGWSVTLFEPYPV